MAIGLFFGSFNPIHTGHLVIASQMAEHAGLEKIWFVVSPQNPFKKTEGLMDEKLRLKMVEASIKKDSRFELCSIEFELPKPSFTIDTLTALKKRYPDETFSIIIGSDNLTGFDQWKKSAELLEQYTFHVYLRETPVTEIYLNHSSIKVYDFPLLHISATYIREQLALKKSVKYLVSEEVEEMLKLLCS